MPQNKENRAVYNAVQSVPPPPLLVILTFGYPADF